MTHHRMQRVQRNGLVTLPKWIRDKAGIQEGDYVEVQATPEGILVKILDVKREYRRLTGA